VVGHLRAQGYASLIDLAQALFPECFVGDDLGPRQAALESLREQCAQLVESGVLSTAYSPTDGELVYCIREVFLPLAGASAAASPGANPELGEAQPAVFRRRGDSAWRAEVEAGGSIAASDADVAPAPAAARSDYAVFFKLGTVLRPTCDLALRDLARAAAHADEIHVVGLATRLSGVAELSALLASQRAAIVANRLVDCGIDRFRIEMSVRSWDERPLPTEVFAVDPPKSLSAQSRRVDINLKYA
jgi:hypothetical protein